MPPGPRLPSALRLVTQRLAETPPEQLHYHASSLIVLLEQYKVDLQRHPSTGGKGSSAPDETVPLHKFKTQVSTLLQSKEPESRWLAVVLVKVYLEIGGFDAIQSSGQWVRTITGFTGHKTEHATVKRASITTLTKIFLLSYSYPNLVREITTPVFQPFITHCLTSIGSGKGFEYHIHCHPEVLSTVLQCFILLLPKHPASFRPHLNDIRLILSQLVTPVSARGNAPRTTPECSVLGRQLLALLPNCAPKNGAAEEWSKNIHAILQHASRTADHILRAIEANDTVPSTEPHYTSVRNFKDILTDNISDFLALTSWQGVSEGIERLAGLLRILEAYLATSNQFALTLPVSQVWNELQRLLSASGPFVGNGGEIITPSMNPEVGRDERENLWANLPWLHGIAFDVLSTLLRRVGSVSFALAEQTLEKIAWVVEREGHHHSLRLKLYRTASHAISIIGPSLSKDNISTVRSLLTAACSDAQALPDDTASKDPISAASKSTKGSILGHSQATESSRRIHAGADLNDPLQTAALRVLGEFVSRVQSSLIPRALRASIDKAIILVQDENALIGSVLNPDQRTVNGKQTSSNLPFLSRAYPASDAVEALIRPRLPVIRTSFQQNIDTEMEIDGWRYKQDDLTRSEPEQQLPASHESQSYVSRPVMGTDVPEVTSAGRAVEEPIQSPKRPRDTNLEAVSINETTGIEPSNKRMKEDDTAPAILDRTPQGAGENEPKSSAQVDTRNFDIGGAKNIIEEDYEIPPIQMPSDFEDSDEDDEGEETEEE